MFKELKKSTPSEMGPYLCSKWIHHYFLIDAEELKDFLLEIRTDYIYPIGKVLTSDQFDSTKELIESYSMTVEKLKKNIFDCDLLKKKLPLGISKTPDSFYLHSPKEGLYTIKAIRPILQLQVNLFRYSKFDQTIQLNYFGDEGIFWGLKLSYPQIFQDPKSNQIFKIDKTFENFSYYALIRKWLRAKTNPIRFIIDNKKITSQLRVGKKCLSWVHLHPQLEKIGCEIECYAN